MKYVNPTFKVEYLEANDVITTSLFRSEVTVTEVFEDQAEVSVSANDVLG